jgi:hypothetical protein
LLLLHAATTSAIYLRFSCSFRNLIQPHAAPRVTLGTGYLQKVLTTVFQSGDSNEGAVKVDSVETRSINQAVSNHSRMCSRSKQDQC